MDWWFNSTGEKKAKEEAKEEAERNADKYRLVDFPLWYKGELGKRERAKRGVGQADQPIAEPAE